MIKTWCKSHGEFHQLEDIMDSCYVEQTTQTASSYGRERDAYEMGPDGSVGLRLVAGFEIEEGRT